MFCSSCGASVTPGLNYCNRCGKELSGAIKQSETEIESLIWAIVSITVGGIGVIIGLMAVMKNVAGLSSEVITLITLVCFSLILLADLAFIWMLVKRTRAGDNIAAPTNQLNQAEPQKLVEMPAAQRLSDAMPPSVVEQTTRNLEPVYREPKKQ